MADNVIKIGLCQMKVESDKTTNIETARDMVGDAARAGCKIAVLPEMFNCPYQAELFPVYAEEFPAGQTIAALGQMARDNNIALIGGSIPEREGEKIYNTSFIFNQDGHMLARHRKVHLFDVDISAGTVFKESATLSAGNSKTVVELCGLKIGVGICYDMRFAELARAMTLAGAQILVYPGAFGPVTGPAHWELLLRSRAVDNQVFVAGASPALNSEADYKAYGHSMVVDPWGRILTEAGQQPELIVAQLNLDLLDKIRRELPLLKHRRPELYM